MVKVWKSSLERTGSTVVVAVLIVSLSIRDLRPCSTDSMLLTALRKALSERRGLVGDEVRGGEGGRGFFEGEGEGGLDVSLISKKSSSESYPASFRIRSISSFAVGRTGAGSTGSALSMFSHTTRENELTGSSFRETGRKDHSRDVLFHRQSGIYGIDVGVEFLFDRKPMRLGFHANAIAKGSRGSSNAKCAATGKGRRSCWIVTRHLHEKKQKRRARAKEEQARASHGLRIKKKRLNVQRDVVRKAQGEARVVIASRSDGRHLARRVLAFHT